VSTELDGVRSRAGLVSTVVVVLLAAFGVWALWPGGTPAHPTTAAAPALPTAPPTGAAELAPLRAAAALDPCPGATGTAPAGSLAGVTVPCLGEERTVDLGAALAGRTALINVWASWCAPCRTELPALAEYAARPGSVPVLGVDVRDDPRAALRLLTDLDVRLPSVTDPDGALTAALDVPPALPMTYVVRADGSVARVDPPIPFGSADDVARAVAELT
jgi:thiol-disulfide isomerase/thioredoxin